MCRPSPLHKEIEVKNISILLLRFVLLSLPQLVVNLVYSVCDAANAGLHWLSEKLPGVEHRDSSNKED